MEVWMCFWWQVEYAYNNSYSEHRQNLRSWGFLKLSFFFLSATIFFWGLYHHLEVWYIDKRIILLWRVQAVAMIRQRVWGREGLWIHTDRLFFNFPNGWWLQKQKGLTFWRWSHKIHLTSMKNLAPKIILDISRWHDLWYRAECFSEPDSWGRTTVSFWLTGIWKLSQTCMSFIMAFWFPWALGTSVNIQNM